MAQKRSGLGRGIGALIPSAPEAGDRPVDVFFPEPVASDSGLAAVPGAVLAQISPQFGRVEGVYIYWRLFLSLAACGVKSWCPTAVKRYRLAVFVRRPHCWVFAVSPADGTA